jgi:very-short-patch-repair endonuclease
MKCVRQEPIGRHFVDFVCRERRLIVELDGGQHADSERDAVRNKRLRDNRYRVLRFWNNDVIKNIDGILDTIAAALISEKPSSSALDDRDDRSILAGAVR